MARHIAESAYFKASPLRDDLDWGVTVADLRLSDLDNPLMRQNLYDLWINEGVIVFENIASVPTQLALSRVFGPLRGHPAKESISDTSGELMTVDYNPDNGWLMRVDGELRGTWLPWHSDLIYVDKINHGGILRPITIPSKWGDTGFVDQVSAYQRLPDDIKARIEGLHVIYKYDMDMEQIRFGRNYDVKIERYSKTAASIQARLDDFPAVLHPMVFEQPETGRKVLNVSSWFACGIYEMPGEAGDALLESVVQCAVDERFAYYHAWRGDEMVLWDNWRMLHCATGTPDGETRLMERTTIGGDYGLGRVEPGGAARDAADYIQV